MMLGRTTTAVLGAAGLAFVGYCIYFDRKRRSDPLYKEKIRERRRNARQGGQPAGKGGKFGDAPNMADPTAVQAFFFQEIQAGEEKLGLGMVEEGLNHLINAITICGQPQQLLQVLRQTLPPNIFQQLIARLPTAAAASPKTASRQPPVLEEVEDDLE